MQFHLFDASEVTVRTQALLAPFEGFEPKAYWDAASPINRPTIGLGFNFEAQSTRDYLVLVLEQVYGVSTINISGFVTGFDLKMQNPGFRPSASQYLQNKAFYNNQLQTELDNLVNQNLLPGATFSPFTLSRAQADTVEREILEGYSIGGVQTDGKLTRLQRLLFDNNQISIPSNTNEFVALASLYYNSESLIGGKLLAALKADNRAEAWYQIRYQSNKERSTNPSLARGIASRRYAESDAFGLYNSADSNSPSPDQDEAKSVIRMYTTHRPEIRSYENELSPVITRDGAVLSHSIDFNLSFARTRLIGDFAQFANAPVVSGEVLVGSSIGEFSDSLGNIPENDLLLGEARYNNLHGQGGSDIIYGNIVADDLFGDVGDDWLFGGLGDDVLNGGADDDHLDGGEGRDTLNGGSGVDTLRGGSENDTLIGGIGIDILEGGMGFDTYVTDGMDTIEDLDGFGKVQFGTKTLTGGFRKSSDPQDTWRSVDGDFTYVKQGSNLIVNNTLTIVNYGSGDLGIVLAEEGDRPTGGLPAINYQNGALTISWMGDEDHNTPTFEAPANHFVLGQGGSDILDLGLGVPQFNHIVWGGFGNDLIKGGGGQDQLYGEEGFDQMDGYGGDDVMYGGFGPDFMMGDSRDTARVALGIVMPGNDYLDGGVGDDVVEGGGGNDILYGGLGDDYVGGDDNLVYAVRPEGNDYADGGDGNDLVEGGLGDDVLFGGEGNDELNGDNTHSNRVLVFNRVPAQSQWVTTGGFVFMDPEGGDDYLDGQAGNDKLFGDGGDDILFGGDGQDILWGDDDQVAVIQEGADWLEGGADDDQLVGGGGEDALFGGDGDDLIVGDYFSNVSQGASDTLDGGNGDDELQGGGGDDVLDGGAGVDLLFGDDGNDLLDGGEGADQLQGGLGDDVLSGGADNDVLFGEDGADSLFGDDGADALAGGDGADVLDGGAGDDQLFGELGNDVLFGEAGNDTLSGEEGLDVLIGGDGQDAISGGLDNDQLVGGRGSDVYLYDLGDGDDVIDDMALAGEGNQIQFGAGITLQSLTFMHDEVNQTLSIQVAGGGSIQLIGFDPNAFEYVVDTISFSSGQQVLIADQLPPLGGIVSANDRDNLIRTGPTDDTISALGGNDVVLAGAGNDQITGGMGNDALTGSTGQDAYFFNAGDGRDTIIDAAGEGNRLIFGQGISSSSVSLSRGQGQTLILSTGNAGDQLVFSDTTGQGGSPVDTFEFSGGSTLTFADLLARGITINGTDGADVIDGTSTVDVIFAADGDDLVRAGDGNDVVRGEAGNDSLEGQAGNDVLVGGAGDDQLLGGAGDDTYQFNIGDGLDSISDVIAVGESNQVTFGSGLTPESLKLTTVFGQVLVRPGSAFEGVYIGANGSDVWGAHAVEHFEFADGTVLSYADLLARGFDIDGTEFDDVLIGTNVVDRFRGGLGTDRLEGGEGNDSYFFNTGDGVDTIVDTALTSAGNELVFGPGIALSDLRLDLAPDQSDSTLRDLQIRVGANGDAIQLDTFDRNNVFGPRTVDSFRFTDGGTLTYEQLLARGFDLTGSESDDQIAGTNVADRIVAGDGVDVLRAGAGDDTLDGGLGNDRLFGGQGNDIFVFGPGSGQDTIIESQGSLDTIRMTPGVAPSDVVATRNDRDLVLSLNGGADRLTVSLYFLAAPFQIERVQFADGTVWDQAFLENLTQPAIAGTGGPDSLTGTSGDDRLLGLAGDDQLTGLAGDDRLDGGTGADQLAGGAGDDLYIVDDAGDTVTELVDEGTDLVQSAISYQLSANVENLTLIGTAAIDGTGNELDNVLTSNSAANVLTGGLGNDTYVISTGDTVVELAGEGTDTVEAGVSTTLGANVENLTLTGGASLIGTGNALNNVLQADGSISVLAGGDGNDTYLIGADGGDDILVETATGGIDTVIAAHDYRLPDHIENLTLLDPRVPDFANFSLTPYAPYGPSWVRTAGYGNDLNNTLIGGRANNLLDGGLGADTLIGGAGDDTYLVDHVGDVVSELANEGTDTIESSETYTLSANVENLTLTGAASANGTGNALNNDIRGNTASNILDGGAGDDSLQGFGGADIYLFGRGSGRDIVSDASVAGEVDTIEFDQAVAPGDVDVYRDNYNLVLTISGATDELTLQSFFDSSGYDLKQVRFSDGTVWNSAELSVRAVVGSVLTGSFASETISGGDGYDVLIGSAGNDVVVGGRGKDVLYGDLTFQSSSGNQIIGDDTLLGGDGDDTLYDFRGMNLFDGGAGNDSLTLGTGVDTILFGRGSGDDVVSFDSNGNDIDIIQLAAGIAPADVVLTWRSASRADLVIGDSGDTLTVQLSSDWFSVGQETTQAIVRFADGAEWNLAWSSSHIDIPTATSFDDVLQASFPATLTGLGGNDTYLMGSSGIPGTYAVIEASGGGIDTVESLFDYVLDEQVENLILAESASAERGTGNELDNLIVGNSGDNVLDGGAGNDILVGGVFRELEGPPYLEGTGSDILIGGAGDDVLMADAGDLVSNGEWLFLGGGLTSRDVSGSRDADDLLIGGTGNDTYIVHSQQQTVVEFTNEGSDLVKSTVSYTLGENLENLMLVSPPLRFDDEDNVIPPAPLNGTGNGLDNLIIGSGDDNVLSGLAGNDTLWGGSVIDPDSGSARSGNDTLLGGTGNDTYIFNLGEGIDTIEDVATLGEGNRIQFGAGISRSDLTFTEDTVARTLTIHVGSGGTDQLVLTNFDATGVSGSLVVETLAFADGSSANLASLLGPSITITGTEAADVLVGTTESDGIDAGAGNDTVYAGAGNDLILAGAGDDVVAGEEGADTIYGGAGVDYLYGGGGTDVINGDDGDDVLVGEADDDTLIGGLGNDVLNGGIGNDHLVGGDGDDTIYAGVGDDLIEAGDGNDAVVGEEGADAIYGGAGADYLYGGDGDDLVNGDEGSDVLVGETGNDTLNGGLGDDVLNGGDGEDVLSGEDGNDTVYAGMGNDVISGGAGDDAVNGDDGADTISGGIGADYLYGGNGDDSINGDEGNDTLVGEDGLDVLNGGAGNDVLNGGAAADQLYGGDGDDSLYIDAADTVVSGGDGYDVVVVTGIDGVTFDVAGAGIELMAGSVGNDVLTAVGSSNSITFYGGDGMDQLTGGNASDVLVGDGGDDLLSGGEGNDVLNGGLGDDTLSGGSGDDAFYAGAGNDLINGGDGTDSVSGDEGNDVIAGGAGGDYLYGGIGDDVINGDAGNDVLVGEADNDTLAGGVGNDRLVGGTGNDVYRFGAGGGSDVIAEADSTSGNQDLLQFDFELTPLDLVLSQQANDLRIAIHGTTDQILLENWFLGEDYQVETIEAGTGGTLLNAQVDQLIQAMASFSQQSGLTWDQAIDQQPQDVQTVLAASWQ